MQVKTREGGELQPGRLQGFKLHRVTQCRAFFQQYGGNSSHEVSGLLLYYYYVAHTFLNTAFTFFCVTVFLSEIKASL